MTGAYFKSSEYFAAKKIFSFHQIYAEYDYEGGVMIKVQQVLPADVYNCFTVYLGQQKALLSDAQNLIRACYCHPRVHLGQSTLLEEDNFPY